MERAIRKRLLLAISIASLATGGAIVYRQWALPQASKPERSGAERVDVRHVSGPSIDAKGHFPAQSVERYIFSQGGRDLFDLLVARYRDEKGIPLGAVLFPRDAQGIASTPTGSRSEIWRSAAETITRKAPEDALFLSWWDDGQRIHYLGGRDSWLRKPSAQTFANPVWNALKDQLPAASDEEQKRLVEMARWLTMDSGKALSEIAARFGTSRPVYLLVNNDLLLHLAEFAAYGGSPLSLHSKNIPAGNDLHGDIAQVKRWAYETGDGNYLAQQEGSYYRVWATADGQTKNTLLVRLLPFVHSLKKLPDGVSLVYQSHWGGFLSVYKIDAQPAVDAEKAE